MKTKKIPMRLCLGCREMKPKRELLRVVRDTEGELHIDKTGKASGRGAYICRSTACLEKSIKSKALSRALEAVAGEELFLALREELAGID